MSQSAPQTVTAEASYQRLKSDRNAAESRAKQCATLTLPTLYKEVSKGKSSSSRPPYQGTGARCVNSASARFLLALLPVNANFFKLSPDGTDDLDDVLEFVQGVEDHCDAFRAWVEHLGVTNFIHEDFDNKYAGEANSEQAWIEDHLEETGVFDEVPENLRPYFDTDAYLRDTKLGGDVSFTEYDGTHYAFWA